MEIADLNLISDFEAGIKCLQNPSLISKLSLIGNLPQLYSFCTYGALIIAVFATFTNIFNKIKTLIRQIHQKILLTYHNTQNQNLDFNFSDTDDSDYDYDYDMPSSVSESDDDDEKYVNDVKEDLNDTRKNEVFRVEGHNDNNNDDDSGSGGNNYKNGGYFGNLTRNGFSWSDFSAGKSVVQLWDSFGLGLDFEDDESEIAIWDLDREVKLSSGRRVTTGAAETVVLTAEVDGVNGGVGFGTYDSRVDEKAPAIYAAWRPRQRKVWFDGEGGQKVE